MKFFGDMGISMTVVRNLRDAGYLETGAIVMVEDSRYRLRRLPI